jgi:hypothetical protein
MPHMDTHEQQVENAIADPTRFYASPMDVVHDEELDVDQKRRILESWKRDAELLSTAQDENMAGGERPQLQDVSLALGALDKLGG